MDIRIRDIKRSNPIGGLHTDAPILVYFITVRVGHFLWQCSSTSLEIESFHLSTSLKSLPDLPSLTSDEKGPISKYLEDLASNPMAETKLRSFLGTLCPSSQCDLVEGEYVGGFMRVTATPPIGGVDNREVFCLLYSDTLYLFEDGVTNGNPCELPLGSVSLASSVVDRNGKRILISNSDQKVTLVPLLEHSGEEWFRALENGAIPCSPRSRKNNELSPKEKRSLSILCDRFPSSPKTELLYFLRGNQGNVDDAERLHRAHLEWKKDVDIDNLKISSISDLLREGRIVYPGTKDKLGRPIVIFRAAKHYATINFMDTLIVAMYLMKRAIEDAGDSEQFALIVDLDGFDNSNNDFRMNKLILELYMAHFPERIGAAWCVSSSWVFRVVFRVIKPWLGDDLLSRVYLYGGKSELKQFIDSDQLPEDLGGSFRIDTEAWINNRCAIEGVEDPKKSTVHLFPNEEFVAAFSDAPCRDTADNCIYQGWCKKQGGFVKKFNKRFCILKGTILYYYRSESDKKADGVIFLRGSTLVTDDSSTFHIITSGGKDCIFQLSDKSQRRWIEELRNIILANGGKIGTEEVKEYIDPVSQIYFQNVKLPESTPDQPLNEDVCHADELFSLFNLRDEWRVNEHGLVPGSQIIDVLNEHSLVDTREQACDITNLWLQQKLLYSPDGPVGFNDSMEHFYVFPFTSPCSVMNFSRVIPLDVSPVEGDSLAKELHSMLVEVIETYRKKEGVDVIALRKSREYFDFTLATCKLQTVRVDELTRRDSKSRFYLNIHSLLLLHAQLERNFNYSQPKARFQLFHMAEYCIGLQRFSLEDLAHGMLRSNAAGPTRKFTSSHFLNNNDARIQLGLQSPLDERVSLALYPGLIQDPFHYSRNIEQSLDECVDQFLAKCFEIKNNQILVSGLIQFVTKETTMEFLAKQLPKKTYEKIRESPIYYQAIPWENLGIGRFIKKSSVVELKKEHSSSSSSSQMMQEREVAKELESEATANEDDDQEPPTDDTMMIITATDTKTQETSTSPNTNDNSENSQFSNESDLMGTSTAGSEESGTSLTSEEKKKRKHKFRKWKNQKKVKKSGSSPNLSELDSKPKKEKKEKKRDKKSGHSSKLSVSESEDRAFDRSM